MSDDHVVITIDSEEARRLFLGLFSREVGRQQADAKLAAVARSVLTKLQEAQPTVLSEHIDVALNRHELAELIEAQVQRVAMEQSPESAKIVALGSELVDHYRSPR
jgi:hypothetical protein